VTFLVRPLGQCKGGDEGTGTGTGGRAGQGRAGQGEQGGQESLNVVQERWRVGLRFVWSIFVDILVSVILVGMMRWMILLQESV
jgi:hypothetical protein